MKKVPFVLIVFSIFTTHFIVGQSNSYPSFGDVTIRNYSPQIILQRSETDGGFIAGIQTKLMDGTNSWYFGNLHSNSWIVGAGSFQNPKLSILSNGNVGIGTETPSNIQNWSNVLDVAGAHHSKILATAVNSTYRTGIFSHNSEWYGGGGFVGTESNHNLHLITNYNVKMSILTNGNVGIGTTTPSSMLTVAGNIASREVKVTVDAGADFVFEKEYNVPSLESVDQFIKKNKHLPEIASAEEMKKDGINLSEMNIKLLQKIEELTLYAIEQEKKNKDQSKQIEELRKENEAFKLLSERISKLEKQSK